jgi:hypothetical protein
MTARRVSEFSRKLKGSEGRGRAGPARVSLAVFWILSGLCRLFICSSRPRIPLHQS